MPHFEGAALMGKPDIPAQSHKSHNMAHVSHSFHVSQQIAGVSYEWVSWLSFHSACLPNRPRAYRCQ